MKAIMTTVVLCVALTGALRRLQNRAPAFFLSPTRPWKTVETTVFWAGEPPTPGDPGNLRSAWDPIWHLNALYENPFYFALPYNDIEAGHTKPEAPSVIPWFRNAFVRDGQSVLEGRWIAIRHNRRICYAQWADVGPYHTDDVDYVFGSVRPKPHPRNDAALDVSPAVRDYLGLSGLDTVDWRFVSCPAPGPWMTPVFARK